MDAEADVFLCWVHSSEGRFTRVHVCGQWMHKLICTPTNIEESLHCISLDIKDSFFQPEIIFEPVHDKIYNNVHVCDQQRFRSACTSTHYGKGSHLSLFG